MQHCKVRRLAGFMFFFALILPFLAHAAGTPTITSISGALTNGNTITVNGSNFIQMNTANWIPFFQNNPNASNFGGASPAADGYSTQGPKGGVYDTSFYLMGTQSMRFDISGVSTTCPQDNLFNYNAILSGGGDAQDLWIRAYVAYNSADNLWIANQAQDVYVRGGMDRGNMSMSLRTGRRFRARWRQTMTACPIAQIYRAGRSRTGGGTVWKYIGRQLLLLMCTRDGSTGSRFSTPILKPRVVSQPSFSVLSMAAAQHRDFLSVIGLTASRSPRRGYILPRRFR